MLPVDLETVRLFLHVLAATVWVGGQLVLAALVPALRSAGPGVPRTAARAFNRVAWPAFGVLVATGIWNIVAEGDKGDGLHHLDVDQSTDRFHARGVVAVGERRDGRPQL